MILTTTKGTFTEVKSIREIAGEKKCIMYFSTLKLFLFGKQTNSFDTGNERNRKT